MYPWSMWGCLVTEMCVLAGVVVEEGVAARCLACLGLRAPTSSQVVPGE